MAFTIRSGGIILIVDFNEMDNNACFRIWPIFIILLIFCLFVAIIFLWSSEPYGVGVSHDSINYIRTARSILLGEGFHINNKLITHYPPTYPLLLASSGIFGIDPLYGARWLHTYFFATTAILIGICVYFCTRTVLLSLCSILLFIFSPIIFKIHIMAWSEPPFIFFALSAFLLLALYLINPNNLFLVGSSFMLSLALTTRYIGITLLPPMILTLILLEDKPLINKIRDSLLLLAIGVFPLATWFIRNIIFANSAANRNITFHLIGFSHIKQIIANIISFYLPISEIFYINKYLLMLLVMLILLSIIVLLLYLLKHIRHNQKINVNIAPQLFMISFTITYLLFLLISISLFDARTPIDNRILSPIHVIGIILIASIPGMTSNFWNKVHLRWSFYGLLFLVICINAVSAISLMINHHNNGSGFTNKAWGQSESIEYIKSLQDDKTVYSNAADVVEFLTGKHIISIPSKYNPTSMLSNSDFAKQLNFMLNDLKNNKAIIIYLDNINWRRYLPTKEDLENIYHIPMIRRFEDGVLYGIN
jgi:hypothetical protein